jgi:hypothetical protein
VELYLGKTGKTLVVAGLVFAGLAASLLRSADAPTAPKPVASKQTVQVAAKKTSSPRKRAIAKRSASIENPPLARATGLNVRFPAPTPVTIALASAPRYVKISHAGGEVNKSGNGWDCVEDKNSGLVWEKKTQDRGLRDAGNFYSWYNPAGSATGVNAGVPDNGKCRGGVDCDTNAYVQAVNNMKLCGYSDWRLPTRAELATLVQFNGKQSGKGMIDSRYFPSAPTDWYWTADSDVKGSRHAWYVLFLNGRSMKAPKSDAKRVRLVRTGRERSMRNVARSGSAVTINPNEQAAIESDS